MSLSRSTSIPSFSECRAKVGWGVARRGVQWSVAPWILGMHSWRRWSWTLGHPPANYTITLWVRGKDKCSVKKFMLLQGKGGILVECHRTSIPQRRIIVFLISFLNVCLLKLNEKYTSEKLLNSRKYHPYPPQKIWSSSFLYQQFMKC